METTSGREGVFPPAEEPEAFGLAAMFVDLNGDGEFEPARGEMWIDIEEDGVNGNERLYDPMAPGEAPRGPVPLPPKTPGKSGGHL